MMLGEAIGLHTASIRAVTRRAGRGQAWEAALLGVHLAGYVRGGWLTDLAIGGLNLFGSHAQALRYLNATGRLTRAAA